MDNTEKQTTEFEDIASSTPSPVVETAKKVGKAAKKGMENYGEKGLKGIDKVIKLIAFVVSIFTFFIFLAGSVVLYFFDSTLLFVSALILLFVIVISLISLYLIYGLGHIITQNKEILKRLK